MPDTDFTPALLSAADFKRDRIGTNGYPEAKPSRITYMAHARGYVMVRHPGCMPFVLDEKTWRSFPYSER